MINAEWISVPDFATGQNIYFEAMTEFEHDGKATPIVKICADSYYKLYLNEQLVARGPIRGNRNVNYYDEHDAAPFLKPGKNRCHIMVYSPVKDNFNVAPLCPALLAEMPGGFRTGTAGWQVRALNQFLREVPQFSTQTGFMEYRDFRMEEAVWQAPATIPAKHPIHRKALIKRNIPPLRHKVCAGELIGAHGISQVLDADLPQLAAAISTELKQKIVVSESHQQFKIMPSDDYPGGVSLIFDFNRDRMGYLAAVVNAPAGTIVDVVYGEEIWREKPDRVRSKFPINPTYNFTDRYILKDGDNIIGTEMVERGFRVIMLNIRNFSAPVIVNTPMADTYEYPLPAPARFSCSDELLNRIHACSAETVQACAYDTVVDCPWREHAFWVNDLLVVNAALLALYGANDLHRRSFEMAFAQSDPETGLIPGVCPEPSEYAGQFLFPSVNLFMPLILHDYYMASGDIDTVKKYLPQCAAIVEAVKKFADVDGIITPPEKIWNFYDWSFESNQYSFNGCTESMTNCLLVLAGKTINELAEYAQLPPLTEIPEIEPIIERFFNHNTGLIEDKVKLKGEKTTISSQLAHAIAWLASRNDGKLSINFMRAVNNHNLLAPDLYLHFFVLRAITEAGGNAIPAGLERIRKYWGPIIADGAPTLYEAAIHGYGTAAFDGAASLCHAFAASPVMFFNSAILGIKPLLPGYAKFSVAPCLADLDFAQGTIPTPAGNIEIKCAKIDGGTEIELNFPPALQAILDDKSASPGTYRLPGR